MPEVHLRQREFTFSACRLFTKNKERIEKIKETGDSRDIYQNKPNKICFQQGMTYGDFKNFPRRTASDKVLHNNAFNIPKSPKFDAHQCEIPSLVCKCLDKKSSGLLS